MTTKTPFKKGEKPFYESEVNRLKQQSTILQGGFWREGDPISPHHEYRALYGDKDGIIADETGTESIKALIPMLQEKISEMQAEYDEYKEKRRLQGYETPEGMPANMEEKYMTLWATLTVRKMEGEKLLQSIEAEKDNAEIERVQKMWYQLQTYGLPCGHRGGDVPIKTIDGQKCEVIEGEVYIKDPASPYNGMLVKHYRQMANDFKKSETYKKFRGRTIPKDKLPQWPEYAKRAAIA